jgi:hypothetical protein
MGIFTYILQLHVYLFEHIYCLPRTSVDVDRGVVTWHKMPSGERLIVVHEVIKLCILLGRSEKRFQPTIALCNVFSSIVCL